LQFVPIHHPSYCCHEKQKKLPPISVLHEYFNYEPDIGVLKWKVNSGGAKKDKAASRRHHAGYIVVGLLGEDWLVHRIIWAMLGENSKLLSKALDELKKDD